MAADHCCGTDCGLVFPRQLVSFAPGNPGRILVDVPVNRMEAKVAEQPNSANEAARENEEQQETTAEQQTRLRQREEREQRERTDQEREAQERQRSRSGSRER